MRTALRSQPDLILCPGGGTRARSREGQVCSDRAHAATRDAPGRRTTETRARRRVMALEIMTVRHSAAGCRSRLGAPSPQRSSGLHGGQASSPNHPRGERGQNLWCARGDRRGKYRETRNSAPAGKRWSDATQATRGAAADSASAADGQPSAQSAVRTRRRSALSGENRPKSIAPY